MNTYDIKLEKCGVLILIRANKKAFEFLTDQTRHHYDKDHDGFLCLLEDLPELKSILKHEGFVIDDRLIEMRSTLRTN